MTKDEEKNLKNIIAMFHDDVDWKQFKSPEDYMEFREKRIKKLTENNLEKCFETVGRLSKGSSTYEDWKDAFESLAWNFGHRSNDMFKLYKEYVKSKTIPSEFHLPLLLNIYVNYGVDKTFVPSLINALKSETKGSELDRINQNRELFKDKLDKDGRLTIHRGEYIDAFEKGNGKSSVELEKAVSFTLDWERAEFYACRWRPAEAKIYTAKVPVENIIAYVDERNESEVIIEPISKKGVLFDVTETIVDPEEFYNKDKS